MITFLLIIILGLKHTIYDPAAVSGMKLKKRNLNSKFRKDSSSGSGLMERWAGMTRLSHFTQFCEGV